MSASTAPVGPEDVEQRVRRRLRRLRGERGLTLAQVAAAAAMDTSTLSRLESGRRRLTLAHLPGLARALGVTPDELWGASARRDPRVRAAPQRLDGITLWPLTNDTAAGTRAYRLLLPADRREPMLRTHEGHQWLYVLAGHLRLVLEDEEFVLTPGEAAEFSTLIPHWSGVVDGPVELLTIFGAHGEGVHLRSTDPAGRH